MSTEVSVDINRLVQVLQQAHGWVRDAAVELESDVEYAAEEGLTIGRGTQISTQFILPNAVYWLEELADRLEDHFGVVFLHEVDSDDLILSD